MNAAVAPVRFDSTVQSQSYRVVELSRSPDPADRTLIGIHIEQSVWKSPPELASGKMTIRAYALAGRMVRSDRAPLLLGSMGGNFDAGTSRVQLTGGTMILLARARGYGLGTYLMNEVVRWAKTHCASGAKVRPVSVAERDAETQDEADRRNRFYEQFGFRFDDLKPFAGVERATGRSVEDQTLDEFTVLDHVRGVSVYEADEGLAMIAQRQALAEAELERVKTALVQAIKSNQRFEGTRNAQLKVACWWGGIATLATLILAGVVVRWL